MKKNNKNLKFSRRSQKLSPSPLQKFFVRVKKLQKEGKDIVSLGIGDLEENTPEIIKKSATEAIRKNVTKYIPASGSEKFKEIIAKKYKCQKSEIIISSGAKSVIGAVLWTILDRGDQIIIPTPYYPPFLEVAKSLFSKPIFIDTRKDEFKLAAKSLEKAIKEKKFNPKVLIINSPNNPTGAVYDKNELKKISALSKKYNFLIISDECYNNFSPDKNFSFREIDKNAIIVNSVSKSHAMTGFRIGWAIMDKEIVERATLFLESYIGCPNSIAEQAAGVAINCQGVKDFSTQRKIIYGWLDKMGIGYSKSEGGFYVFADFSNFLNKRKGIKNSEDLANYLLERGVAVTPGSAFGNFKNYIRLAFPISINKLEKALKIIEKGLLELC